MLIKLHKEIMDLLLNKLCLLIENQEDPIIPLKSVSALYSGLDRLSRHMTSPDPLQPILIAIDVINAAIEVGVSTQAELNWVKRAIQSTSEALQVPVDIILRCAIANHLDGDDRETLVDILAEECLRQKEQDQRIYKVEGAEVC